MPRVKRIVLLVSLVFVSFIQANAAPHPAVGSSILTDPEKSLVFLSRGFQLSTEGSNWRPSFLDSQSVFPEIRFEMIDKKFQPQQTAKIILRIEEYAQKADLEENARKWIKEFPHYGFSVLGNKMLRLGGGSAFLVDLAQKDKQLRQIVFHKNRKMVTLTCVDQRESFKNTLAACNQISKSFNWIDEQLFL